MAEQPRKSTPKKAAGSRSSSRKSADEKAREQAEKAEQQAREAQQEPATPGVQDTPNPSVEGTDDVNAGVTQVTEQSQAATPDSSGDSEERAAGGMQQDEVVRKTGNKEAGLSPSAYQAGDEPAPTAATDVNRERNGAPLEIGTTTSGPTEEAQANTPIAATGYGDRNGAPVEVHEQGQTSTEFGGNDDPTAQLINGGVRGEVGTGTGTEAPADERPEYPTRALNRRSERGKPFQPTDSEHQADPQHGDMMTSTDATAANAVIQTHAGDNFVALRGEDGEEIKPSQFFEVPENGSNAIRVVNQRVSEEYTVWHTTTTSQRLLYPKGAEVPVQIAEQLIHLHG